MGVRSEKIKSVIVTTDRNFKNKMIQLFNATAFPGEKFTVTTGREAADAMKADPLVLNIVISGADFSGERLGMLLADTRTEFESKKAKVLVYLDDTHMDTVGELQGKFPKVMFKQLPAVSNHFIEVFHKKPKKGVFGQSLEKNEEKPAPKPTKNFFEASGHIKDTVTLINIVNHDKKNLTKLAEIGQRFNGFIGAFAFLASKPGYNQLAELATVIDDITRYYQMNPELTEITDGHFALLRDSAVLCYNILKYLRDGNELTDAMHKEFERLKGAYDKLDIRKRSKTSQEDIDSLLDSLGL